MTHTARLLLSTALIASLGVASPTDLGAQTVSPQPVTASATSAPGGPSLGRLVENTIDDFRQIPSLENLSILVVGGIAATVGRAADRDVTAQMSTADGLGSVLGPGETLGGARTQLAAALATYTIGRATKNRTVSAIGADLISAQILTQAMTAGIKTSVGRRRPDGTQYSFPSGHASVTFATATVLQRHLGWKAGIPAYGLATFVAAQRVQDRRHFLSDVTFGAALGIVAGRSVTVGTGPVKFAVAPAAAPGGAALSFTLVK